MTRALIFLVFLSVFALGVVLTQRATDPVQLEAASTDAIDRLPSDFRSYIARREDRTPPTWDEPTTTTTQRPKAKASSSDSGRRRLFVAAYSHEVVQVIHGMWSERYGPEIATQAVNVSGCETGGTYNPGATGALGERGLFQLHPVHREWIEPRWGWGAMYEVRANIEAAMHLYADKGWQPWSCRYAA